MEQKRTYGRYGEDAWLRWHRRRFRSRSLVVSPVSTLIQVVHTERIIIIMVEVPTREGESNGNGNTGGEYLLDGDAFYLLTYYAEHEAEKRAEADLQMEDPLSEAEIPDYAKEVWERYVGRDDITSVGLRTRTRSGDLRQRFIDAFSLEYTRLISEGEQVVPDEAVKAIRRVAREDKKRYRVLLPATSLPYLGVIRAQQELPLSPVVDLDYIHQIAEYVGIYEEAYRTYDPLREKERL